MEDSQAILTLSSGVVVRVKQPSPLFYRQVMQQIQREVTLPPVPMVTIETMEFPEGEQITNPDDPDYQQAIEDRMNAIGDRTLDAMILMGLDVELPDSDEWIDNLRYFGIVTGDTPQDKTLAYVRNVAIAAPEDIRAIMETTLRGVTVTEGAVADAMAGFRCKVPRLPN